MDQNTIIFLVLLGLAGIILLRFKPKLVRLGPEQALLRNRAHIGASTDVFFDRAYVVPALDSYDILDLSVQTLTTNLKAGQGVHCRDNIRVDVTASIHLKIPRHPEHVILATQQLGCTGVSDSNKLQALFEGRFVEAIKTTFKQIDFEELLAKRDHVRDHVIEVIGMDMNGFQLADISLEGIDQTPIEQLDPDNILDAEGITKITDRTATQHVETNKIRRAAEKQVRAE